jgi:hypothetical protein
MKFIHFGCWNKDKCDMIENKTNISKTMKLLKSTIDNATENKFNFISIAGDNYYPAKTTIDGIKKLEFNRDNFTSGFNCLPKDIMKYIIFGNHDIKKPYEYYDPLVENKKEKENKRCYNLKQQLEYFKDPNVIFFTDVTYISHNTTLIIFIDTTLYEIKNMAIADTCYTENIFPTADKSKDINELIRHQHMKIMEIINDPRNNQCKNLIMIGHHPLYSVKYGDGPKAVNGAKINVLPILINFIKTIIPILKSKNITMYYLCADTHLYQQGIVSINGEYDIHQYIVGTGGTKLDKKITTDQKIFRQDEINIEYTIIYQNVSHGFITVDINDSIDIEFISVDGKDKIDVPDILDELPALESSALAPVLELPAPAPVLEVLEAFAFDHKYLKYKHKYLKLKKKIIK